MLGVLISHQWDIAGEDDFDTSITGGQYFYTFNLNDGWQINGSPTFSYNHEASSGNEWTLPLGFVQDYIYCRPAMEVRSSVLALHRVAG